MASLMSWISRHVGYQESAGQGGRQDIPEAYNLDCLLAPTLSALKATFHPCYAGRVRYKERGGGVWRACQDDITYAVPMQH